jgi:3-deoxy-D-manno-octulosonic-acid transferase
MLQPKMAIFVKYEFWPAYIRALKQRNIPTYSICSIFRPKQYFFQWWGKGQLNVLRAFSHLYVQDEESKALLAAHGVTNATVCGDTRFDRMMEVRRQTAALTEHRAQTAERLEPIRLFTEGCKRVIVAGSTWPKDEELLEQYVNTDRCADRTQNTDQVTKLILVPHEIDEEHLHYIFNLFKGRYVKYSDVSTDRFADRAQNTDQITQSTKNILKHAEVLLIDTMGLLSSIYPFGQVAYIGGGFGVGIHNTIEAAAYGMPVIFGPNYDHFREAKGLIDAGAARSIKNYSELEAALDTALDNHEEIGTKAAEYVQSELGATEKIFAKIFS